MPVLMFRPLVNTAGETPLHAAAGAGYTEARKLLLHARASVETASTVVLHFALVGARFGTCSNHLVDRSTR